jgi:molybdopterin/thiamine biosynthesis adenylyltransferase
MASQNILLIPQLSVGSVNVGNSFDSRLFKAVSNPKLLHAQNLTIESVSNEKAKYEIRQGEIGSTNDIRNLLNISWQSARELIKNEPSLKELFITEYSQTQVNYLVVLEAVLKQDLLHISGELKNTDANTLKESLEESIISEVQHGGFFIAVVRVSFKKGKAERNQIVQQLQRAFMGSSSDAITDALQGLQGTKKTISTFSVGLTQPAKNLETIRDIITWVHSSPELKEPRVIKCRVANVSSLTGSEQVPHNLNQSLAAKKYVDLSECSKALDSLVDSQRTLTADVFQKVASLSARISDDMQALSRWQEDESNSPLPTVNTVQHWIDLNDIEELLSDKNSSTKHLFAAQARTSSLTEKSLLEGLLNHKHHTSTVLIIGSGPVVDDIVKHLILMGVQSFSLYSQNLNYSMVNKYKDLNSSVKYKLCSALDDEAFAETDVVVAACVPMNQAVRINNTCRLFGKKFVYCHALGLSGVVFEDFGANFTFNGRSQDIHLPIFSLKQKASTVEVHLYDGQVLPNDKIIFESRQNAQIALPKGEHVVTEVDGNRFWIKCSEKVSFDKGLAYVKIVERLATTSCNTMQVKLQRPMRNFALNKAIVLSGFTVLGDFEEQKRTPSEDIFINNAVEWIKRNQKLDTNEEVQAVELLRKFYRTKDGIFAPMQCITASIAAQQIMKCINLQHEPLAIDHDQFFVSEWLSLYGNQTFTMTNDKYDKLRLLFGDDLVRRLASVKLLVAGAGAVGQLVASTLSKLGVATDNSGTLTIADAANIRPSNLVTHMLAREQDATAERNKALVTKARVQEENPKVRINSISCNLDEISTHDMDDDFWSQFDAVISTVDNYKAAKYLNRQSHAYDLPLIMGESREFGGHAKVIVPRVSASIYEYEMNVASTKNQFLPDYMIYQPEQVISLAKEKFEYYFHDSVIAANIIDTKADDKSAIRQANVVKSLLETSSTEKEKAFAIDLFEKMFNTYISKVVDQYLNSDKIMEKLFEEPNRGKLTRWYTLML